MVLAPEAPPIGDSNSKGRGTGSGVIGEEGGFRPIIIFVALVARDEPML